VTAIKVLGAVLLVLIGLIAVQRARSRAGQLPNRPHSVRLP
jgi:hypothetical protein